MTVYVQQEDFDVGVLLRELSQADVGAIVTFIGLCRDFSGSQRVDALYVEHYPGMTERQLERVEEEACRRWSLSGCIVVHRYGWFYPMDRIVFVATATVHRHDAFESCQFLIDWLKTRAPFWKKEQNQQGTRWVELRSQDEQATYRWLERDSYPFSTR